MTVLCLQNIAHYFHCPLSGLHLCAHAQVFVNIANLLENPCEGKELCLAPILLESHTTMVVCNL